jgi:hypothetical protein
VNPEPRHERLIGRLECILDGKPVPAHLEEPKWLEKICAEIGLMNLPLDDRHSPEFRKGADLGYQQALSGSEVERLKSLEKLGQLRIATSYKLENGEAELLIPMSLWQKNKFISAMTGHLEVLSGKKQKDFVDGFSYGINCHQQRIQSGIPIKQTDRWPILETIICYQEEIQDLCEKKKTAPEISRFIAARLPQPFRQKVPQELDEHGSVSDKWFRFVERVSRIFRDFGIPLAKLGRPRGSGHPKRK